MKPFLDFFVCITFIDKISEIPINDSYFGKTVSYSALKGCFILRYGNRKVNQLLNTALIVSKLVS